MKIPRDSGQAVLGGLRITALWTPRVLVVGRENTLHVRKKYPATSDANIAAAVQMEVLEIFPMKRPNFVHRIFDKSPTYTLVDIWAWDASSADNLVADGHFSHVIPEDLVYRADHPALLQWDLSGKQNFLAYDRRGFVGGATVVGVEQEVAKQRFLKSLGPLEEEIQEIFVEKTEGPPCLPYLHKIALKGFKVKSKNEWMFSWEMGVRLGAYGLLAYALFLFLSLEKLERPVAELKQTLKVLQQEMLDSQDATGDRTDDQKTVQRIQEWLQNRVSPLKVMNLLSEHLPQKDYLIRLAINKEKFTLTVSGKDPLKVINALSTVEQFKKINLKGFPQREGGGERFRFVILGEM